MSKFKTSIPVDVKGVMALLPKGVHVHKTLFNAEAQTVEIEWDHDAFRTPVTFAVEFPAENIRTGKLPTGVTAVAKVAVVEDGKTGKREDETPKAKAKAPRAPKVSKTPEGGQALSGN